MAYLTNSIGAYQFASIRGAIFKPQEQLEILTRPGVNGNGLRRLGRRGKPFELVTVAFYADLTAAKTALEDYQTLPGSVALTLTRSGVDHGDYNVLEVQEVDTFAVTTPCGNADPTATACMILKWTLLG